MTAVAMLLRVAFVCLMLTAAISPAAGQQGGPQSEPRFAILEFVVEGNTVLPVAAIERAVYRYTGESRTIIDAEAARAALEKSYQDAGYLSVVVELPPQEVGRRGEVRLVVTEAPVNRLRVTGAEYTLPSELRAQVPSLAPGTVPNFQEMQEELNAVVRRSAHREVTPLIAAGDDPGTLAVELKVQETPPLSAFVELNNKQAENTESGRLEANLSYDNLFQRNHSLGVYWFVSPRDIDQANIISATYAAPLGGPGDRLFGVYTYSNSDTPTDVGGATVSAGNTYALLWRDELRSGGRYQHSLTWGVRYNDLKDTNRDVAGFDVESPAMRYPTLSVAYSFVQPWETPGRASTLDAGLTLGIEGLTSRDIDCYGTTMDQFACKRFGADPDFQVLTLGGSHREPLPFDWALTARIRAQFASGPLVPSEQITLGGYDSVRGYYDGQFAGDSGGAARIELLTPRLLTWQGIGVTALGFFDRGILVRSQPLPAEVRRTNLGSVGLGLRLTTSFGLEGRFDWADVIFDPQEPSIDAALPPTDVPLPTRWSLGVRWTY